jgi:uncharacterized protein
MLFDRRYPATLQEKVRVAVWPRRNWKRSIRYVLTRLSRLRTSPHSIAIGAAAGVVISFTPFLGFHFILAGLLAWSLRGSLLASALGTFFGNPLTFPFIWVGSYQLGSKILGLDTQLDGGGLLSQLKDAMANIARASWDTIWYAIEPLWPMMLKPMAVGGVPMGVVAGVISYYLVKKLAGAYQHRNDDGIGG